MILPYNRPDLGKIWRINVNTSILHDSSRLSVGAKGFGANHWPQPSFGTTRGVLHCDPPELREFLEINARKLCGYSRLTRMFL